METQDSAVLILNNAELSGSLNKYISKKKRKNVVIYFELFFEPQLDKSSQKSMKIK